MKRLFLVLFATLLTAQVWADAIEVFIGSNSVYAEGRETDNCIFNPAYSGEYIFYTEGSSNTYGYLLDAYGELLASNDEGGSGNNFRITYNLTAGSTYYIGAGYYNSNNSGYITLMIDINTEEPLINATALNGIVSGGGIYSLGDTVTLTVTPNDDYTFAQWSDGSTDNPRTIIVDSSLQLVAYCLTDEQSLIPITVSADENGTVTGGGIYITNSIATLIATPSTNYHFVQWSDGNTSNPRNYTVTSTTTLTAEFAPNRYYIVGEITTATVGQIYRNENNGDVHNELCTPNNNGVISINAHAADENDWDSQFFFVIADELIGRGEEVSVSFEYKKNTGDGSVIFKGLELQSDPHSSLGHINNTTLYEVTEEWQTYEVSFTSSVEFRTLAIQASCGREDGTLLLRNIEISVDGTEVTNAENSEYLSVMGYGTYNYGDTATLTVTPITGYHFAQWSDGNTSNPRHYIVTGNTTLTAEFAINKYNVSASANNSNFGYIFLENQTVTHGESTQLIAAAKKGYHFTNWSDGNTDVHRNLTITSNTNLIANFVAIPQSTTIHDTLYKDVKIVYDTITIANTIHDTITNTIHDTIYITNTDTIYLQTAINAKATNNLNIYPNPTTQFVTIDADKEFSYTLTNIAGKVLRKEENAASYLIDLSEFKKGVYMLTTSDGVTHKIVKQ